MEGERTCGWLRDPVRLQPAVSALDAPELLAEAGMLASAMGRFHAGLRICCLGVLESCPRAPGAVGGHGLAPQSRAVGAAMALSCGAKGGAGAWGLFPRVSPGKSRG